MSIVFFKTFSLREGRYHSCNLFLRKSYVPPICENDLQNPEFGKERVELGGRRKRPTGGRRCITRYREGTALNGFNLFEFLPILPEDQSCQMRICVSGLQIA